MYVHVYDNKQGYPLIKNKNYVLVAEDLGLLQAIVFIEDAAKVTHLN